MPENIEMIIEELAEEDVSERDRFEEHLAELNKKLNDPRSEEYFAEKFGMYPEYPYTYEEYIERLAKKDKKNYLYITLSPDKKLRNLDRTPSNLENLTEWCEKWFHPSNKFYEKYSWVIESGSHGDHLHVHAVMEMKTSHKHAERLKNFWKKYFPNNQLLTTLNLSSKDKKKRGEYAYLRFDDEQILFQKIEYFINESKGDHENLIDEGLRGSHGFLTDNI